MLSILISTNIILATMFMLMKHPLSMGVILLLQTIMISLITGNLNQNFWFSYILFLIMIGGMLILFMYMTSIASNEKFKMNLKMFPALFLIPPLALLIKPSMTMYMNNSETAETQKQLDTLFNLNKFINIPLSMTLLFIMIYLLLALIAAVKITDFKQGSMRQMN